MLGILLIGLVGAAVVAIGAPIVLAYLMVETCVDRMRTGVHEETAPVSVA